jgi:predicted nucleotidyltransferase
VELATRTGLSASLLRQLLEVFARYPEIQKVLIFGSRAKCTWKPGSDIDLAVFASTMSATRFASLWSELDDLPLIFKLDVLHWDTLDNTRLQQKIVEEGVELPLAART